MVWLVVGLGIALIAMIRFYFLAIEKMNSAINFLLLVLLSEKNYRVHHDSLIAFATESKARNAMQLAVKVTTAFRQLIFDSNSNNMFASVSERLWDLNQAMAISPESKT